jgi:hypothetical protein
VSTTRSAVNAARALRVSPVAVTSTACSSVIA